VSRVPVAWPVVVCAALLLAGCSAPSIDNGVRTDFSSATLKPGDTLFLVQFSDEADLSGVEQIADWDDRGREVVQRLRDTARASQAAAIEAAAAANARFVSLWISNSLVFAGTPELGPELARLPGVAKVWQEEVPAGLDDPVVPAPPFPEPGDGGWEVAALGVPQLHAEGIDGTGVTIGIIDTGVSADHESLAGNYRGRTTGDDHNWWSPIRTFRPEPTDLAGHGTAVAGLAVGDVIGVATGAEWIAGIACTESGCPLSGVVHAMQFMLAPTTVDETDPRPDLRPEIVNSSWVRARDDEPLRRASRALSAAGILQVYAAGNDGPSCGSASPVGEGDAFLSVGAVNESGELATFSARGPTTDGRLAPDVVAPGERVVTATRDGIYQQVSGTSFAAPLVAGVAALMLQANPTLVGRPDEVARLLRASAQPRPDPQCGQPASAVGGVPNDAVGWGFVSAPAAVAAARDWRR
jgi:subtilisin family serine protease